MSRTPPDFVDHPAGYVAARDRGLHRARCRYVVDGDTADFLVDLGWLQYAYVTVRFDGVDTPEIRGGDAAEREAGQRAKARVAELLLDQSVLLRTSKGTTFGRFVAKIWFHIATGTFPGQPTTFALPGDDGNEWVSVLDLIRHERLTKADVVRE